MFLPIIINCLYLQKEPSCVLGNLAMKADDGFTTVLTRYYDPINCSVKICLILHVPRDHSEVYLNTDYLKFSSSRSILKISYFTKERRIDEALVIKNVLFGGFNYPF